jgi:thiol:disulfide interchange protein DsbD
LGRAILFALLGGLILNLMPCVFPVLSLKALKLCRMGSQELAHTRLHGLLYTGGILVCFAAFAAALLALQAAGAGIGWGFQLQNPGFVALLSYIFFLVALNLAGFFEITVSVRGRDFAREHSYAASFFSGVLAAIVATPCTAPFMGVAMGYALTQPPAVAMIVFLALGFGLALPYLALSMIPALRAIMPRPGAWMEIFRRVLAVPMFLSVVWLTWVFWHQAGMTALIWLAGCMALLIAGIAMLKTGQKSLRALAFLLFLTALTPLAMKPMPRESVAADGWTPYTAASFAALESGNDALFVNMTAAWCITCKINERTTLTTKAARDLFAMKKALLIKGDWTNYNPEITAYLQSFGRDGVPLYVYYGPRDGQTGQRPAPVVLPQILTPSTLERTIQP